MSGWLAAGLRKIFKTCAAGSYLNSKSSAGACSFFSLQSIAIPLPPHLNTLTVSLFKVVSFIATLNFKAIVALRHDSFPLLHKTDGTGDGNGTFSLVLFQSISLHSSITCGKIGMTPVVKRHTYPPTLSSSPQT